MRLCVPEAVCFEAGPAAVATPVAVQSNTRAMDASRFILSHGSPLPSDYSSGMATTSRSDEFVALGHPGNDHFAGLETFANPGVADVELVERRAHRRLPDHRPARPLHDRRSATSRTGSASNRSR